MNNTSAIRTRMKSIRQTVQIMNAQKLIAASRIGKARRMLDEAAPYHERIRATIAGVLSSCPEVASPYLSSSGNAPKKRGLLVVSSDKGLAGGYNSNLIRHAEAYLAENEVKYLCVQGQVGITQMSRSGLILDQPPEISIDPPSMFAAREYAEGIFGLYDDGIIDAIDIIYTHYTSSVKLKPITAKLLPLSPDMFDLNAGENLQGRSFEPSPESVLSMLISKYLKGFLYGCFVHAWTSELASRLTAMDSAIRNGNEILDKLNLVYNRARQALITQEITEIVAGAAAMKD